MKKLGLLGLGLVTVLALASCGKKTADSVIEGFNPQLTTLSATYDVDYDMIVNSDNASMKNFEKHLDETTTIEADYTAGSLYLYGKRVIASDNSYSEVLLVKDGENYKYVTSTMGDYEVLASEADALAQMDVLLKKITYREAGWISTKSFTYAENYAHNQFLHDSENVTLDMVEAPTKALDGNGVKLDWNLAYVAYVGDAGTFEFRGTNAATVKANETGLITYSSIAYDAHLDMAIVNPPVPLDLDGTRSLQVNHGAQITKKTDIAHSAPKVAVNLAAAENGSYAVSWFDYANNSFAMTPVQNGGEVTVGMYLGIVVTPAEGYKVEFVKVNGVTTNILVNGIYCFLVGNSVQNISVTFVEESAAVETDATINITQPENGSVAVSYIDYTQGGAQAPQTQIQSGATIDITAGEMWLVFAVTPAEGYELDSILVNGQAASNYGAWLFKLREAGEYNVVVTFKTIAGSEPVVQEAVVNYEQIENATISVVGFTMGDFANMPTVENGGTVAVGKWIGVSVTPAEGYEVDTVTVNGSATVLQAGYYCYSVADTTALNVVVTLKAAAQPSDATVNYAETTNGSFVVKSFAVSNPQAMTTVEDGGSVATGLWIAVMATPAQGYEVKSITVNGSATVNYYGIQCFQVTEGVELTVAVEFQKETTPIYVKIENDWTSVYLYGWADGKGDNSWPGIQMTLVEGTTDVYTARINKEFGSIIFNNNNGSQTANLSQSETINAYIVTSSGEQAAFYENGEFTPVYEAPVLYYVGSATNWSFSDENKLTVNGNTATITITLAVNDSFKIATSSWGSEQHAYNSTLCDGLTTPASGSDIVCTVAGTYLVTVNNLTGTLSTVITVVTE